EDGADREVRRDEETQVFLRRELAELGRIPPGRADDARDALFERCADVLGRSVGGGEVDGGVPTARVGCVAELDRPHLVTGRGEAGGDGRARLPGRPEEGDLHAAALSTSEALARPTAARNVSSPGPPPEAASRSDGRSTVASAASSSAST